MRAAELLAARPDDGSRLRVDGERALPLGFLAVTGDLARLRSRDPSTRLFVHTADPAGLLRQIGAQHPEAQRVPDGVLLGRGTLASQIEPRHLAPSFVVDADAAEIEALAGTRGRALSLMELRELVSAQIETVQYGGFARASRAARSRRGDCSEHAVLLAALARHVGRPARVVLGYVLFVQGDEAFAGGHAWTQVHDGTRWVDLDATLPAGAEAPLYLVTGELVDEGPGFALALVDAVGLLGALTVEVVSAR